MSRYDNSKTRQWCELAFKKMMENSEPFDDTGARIYEGALVTDFNAWGIGLARYTYVKDLLVHMGCIQQIRRGHGRVKSQWLLRHAPDDLAFDKALKAIKVAGKRQDSIDQKILDLTKRINNLEHNLNVLRSLVINE